MSKYAIGDHGYKVSFSGFAYVEADSAEEVETMVIDL